MKNKIKETAIGTLFVTYCITSCIILIFPLFMLINTHSFGYTYEWYIWVLALFLMLLTMGSQNVCFSFFIENLSTVEEQQANVISKKKYWLNIYHHYNKGQILIGGMFDSENEAKESVSTVKSYEFYKTIIIEI
jgi:hypothetical protein